MDLLDKIENKITFWDLYKKIGGNKKEIGDELRNLEKQNLLINFKDVYYKVSTLEKINGWITTGSKNGLFFSNEKPNLDLGSNYDLKNEKNISNKKGLLPNSYVEGYLLDENLIYVNNVIEQQPFEFIGFFKDNVVKGLTKGFDLQISTTFNQENNSWGHYLFDNNSITLKNVITTEKSNTLFSDLSLYLLKNKKHNYIDLNINMSDINLEYKDLTYLPFYTIDGISTKDIDDAIYFNNNKLYVAIADASYYVDKNLDIMAQEKTSTYYLPNKVDHMLPRELSERDISLNPGTLKKVMICELSLNDEAEVISHSFYLANIKTCARLTYNDVDNILNNNNTIESTFIERKNEIIKSINLLNDIIVKHPGIVDQQYRPERTEVILNEDGQVSQIVLEEERTASHKLVEFSMVQANTQAAKYIYDNYEKIALFRNQTADLNNKIQSATYNNQSTGHLSLNTDFYTHFTSPIRRYSDLTIHRIIKDIFTGNKNFNSNDLENLTNHLNREGLKIKSVTQRINDLMKNSYLEHLNEKSMKASIIDITLSGVIFRTEKNIEFFVPAFKIDQDTFNLIEEHFSINPDKNNQQFRDFLYKLNQNDFIIKINEFDPILDKKLIFVDKISKPKLNFK